MPGFSRGRLDKVNLHPDQWYYERGEMPPDFKAMHERICDPVWMAEWEWQNK
jgi:hypothetical protein